MTNNEKFNRMLNQCKHPRLVYNALAGGTPNIQKLAINQQSNKQLSHKESPLTRWHR